MANQKVKALLTMGAWNVIQQDHELKAYYERKINEGKSEFGVINAIKAKLIHGVFTCVRHNRPYEKKKLEVGLVVS